MRGQSSVEFLFFVSIAILIFTFFMWNNSSLRSQLFGIRRNAEAKRLCDRIAFEINTAVRVGDGYRRKFYVDKSLYGISDFNITVEGYAVYLDWKGGSTSSSILVKNITGKIKKGFNLIQNINGTINVTNL